GLLDPAGYLARLRATAPRAWTVVEKILEPGEPLPPWPVAGTTGYDFLNLVGGLFVDPAGEDELTKAYGAFTADPVEYETVVEDTAFYRYNRLTCLNEVGGDPGRFGVSVDAFHGACAEAHDRWPASMLALSTHDTKRSEDVRARISPLSEIPGEWMATVERWA